MSASRAPFAFKKRRISLLGLTSDDAIKFFFGGNALVSMVVLGLITLFLAREGIGFFGQQRQSMEVYRRAGLELVDYMRDQMNGFEALNRYLSDVRTRQVRELQAQGKGLEEINTALAGFDDYSNKFGDAGNGVRAVVNELSDSEEGVPSIKRDFEVQEDRREEQQQLLDAGRTADAAAVKIEAIDFQLRLKQVLERTPVANYKAATRAMATELGKLADAAPAGVGADAAAQMVRFKALTRQYIATFSDTERQIDAWDPNVEVPIWGAFTAFVFGREWVTASAWQDWYGIVPLLVGSILVSIVALLLAVPFGVGAAIYANQVASKREQRIIKPGIEFISAIPSVVLGFFGIAVLGETLRAASGQAWLSWIPGFPYSERLNILTAGCLLGLIAVPTIFSLAEDALNNVPIAFREASMALGASEIQTVLRIMVPASLSGIISAVLLGLGRVIGETMIVLLCAGNRIAIPDFSAGLAVIVQPVHTMTGIIAQEMGEVPSGSIHYRALFVDGLFLFVISLVLNFAAQKIVRRYRWVRT